MTWTAPTWTPPIWISPVWTQPVSTSVFTPESLSGLLADYRFDEGAGTQLTDYSGHGNHGTLGATTAAPTWTAAGLSFDGGDRVNIPVPIASVKTIQWYGSITGGNDYNPIISSDDGSGLSWFVYKNVFWPYGLQVWLGGNLNTAYDPVRANATEGGGAGFTHDGVSDKFYVGGVETGRYTGSSETSASGRVGNLVIGLAPVFPQGYAGAITGLLLYDRAITASEIARNHIYLRAVALSRGMSPYANAGTVRQVYCEGDSITVGVGGVVPWSTGMVTAQTWTRVNQAQSGQTAAQIAASLRQRTLIEYAAGAPKNVVVLHAGTNDFVVDGASPAVAYGHLSTAVGYATSAGFIAIVVPMLSRTSVDAQKNTFNALIAGSSWGSNAVLISPASLPNLVPDGAYANATYFQDGTHPTQTGTDQIGAVIAAALDAIG